MENLFGKGRDLVKQIGKPRRESSVKEENKKPSKIVKNQFEKLEMTDKASQHNRMTLKPEKTKKTYEELKFENYGSKQNLSMANLKVRDPA